MHLQHAVSYTRVSVCTETDSKQSLHWRALQRVVTTGKWNAHLHANVSGRLHGANHLIPRAVLCDKYKYRAISTALVTCMPPCYEEVLKL
jgi:hypothetical protein